MHERSRHTIETGWKPMLLGPRKAPYNAPVLTLAGLILVGVGAATQEWTLAAVGALMAAGGGWLTVRGLRRGVSPRGLAWVAITVGVFGAFLGAVVFADLEGVAMWALGVLALFGGPWLATRVTKEHEV